MNSLFSKSAFALINVAALAVCCSALAVKAETGNLPDSATTAALPAQNTDDLYSSDRFSQETAALAVTPADETTASNKIIDSINSIALNTEAESAAAEQAISQPSAPQPSETANSELAAEDRQNAEIRATAAASEETATETATVAPSSITAQPTVEIAQKVDRPAATVAVENSQQPVAQEEKEVKTAREVLENPVSTSASALTNRPQTANAETVAETPKTQVAQDNVRIGRDTRSGPSYIGIGGNLGFGGDTALGDSSFAIISKIGLTTNFSVRPAVLFRDEVTILAPVTYDFVSRDAVEVSDDFVITAAPYLGAGIAVSTGDNGNLGFLISGGVDVPLSSTFTATAALNVGFLDGAEVGFLLGVGYTFPQISR